MIKLFHSANTAPEVGSHPYFDEFVFFTDYVQLVRGDRVFTVEADEDQIIDVEHVLSYEENDNMRGLVGEVKALIKKQHGLNIDDEIAEGLIDQTLQYDETLVDYTLDSDDFESYSDFRETRDFERSNFEVDSDTAWLLQIMGPRAAKVAGFRGVFLTDEMGRSIAIDMDGREAEFVLFERETA
ncbi:hypothetical protein [Devosia sediminis]|uniref:Uncharacterized protein n=1 Tax=Devosia sediminis TaxID=2798801 RepID=A0A934IYT5_9HYPH|nr:hypothetical protein [Devosia sediminis]MBJ3785590.1 hypothetical protein [Devosia sediminis]